MPESTPDLQPPWGRHLAPAMPIAMGYIPVAFAYGVLARQAGLSILNTVLMSVLVYAGASQFVAIGLIAAGTTPFALILTTFIVNLRHSLLSMALSPHLRHWPKLAQAAFAFELTDETFAVHATGAKSGGLDQPRAGLWLNVTVQLSWILGTALGIVVGQGIADVRPLGLDFALPALFIALICMQIQRWVQVAVCVVSGTLAIALTSWGMEQGYVIVATIMGATLGAVLEQWTNSRS